jgi:hypothetical protein
MTPEYKARRDAKHAADAVRRHTLKAANAALQSDPSEIRLLDFLPKTPRLAWLGGKTFKQGSGGKANAPGRKEEQKQAVAEGLAVIKKLSENPVVVAELAERGLKFDPEEIERSIGGVPEAGLVEGNDVAAQNESENS